MAQDAVDRSEVEDPHRHGGELGEELVESQEEEVQNKIPVTSPTAPTASQLAEHRDGGHLPYRSWCDECVEAFGREEPHLAQDKLHGRTIPVVSLDYLFITPKKVYTHKEFEAEEPELFAAREDHPDVMKAVVIFPARGKLYFAMPSRGRVLMNMLCNAL